MDDFGHAGIGIDLDLGNVRARGKGEVGGIVERRLFETGLQVLRIVVRDIGGQSDFGDGLGLVGADDPVGALVELDVVDRGLHQMSRNLAALEDDLVAGPHDGGSANGDGSRPVGAHSHGDAVGIALHDLDILDRQPKGVRDNLGEGGLVTLAVAVGA